jgi:hypothetical protein
MIDKTVGTFDIVVKKIDFDSKMVAHCEKVNLSEGQM